MLCILKTIVVWLILAIVGSNIIGFIVRGLVWSPPPSDEGGEAIEKILKAESRRMGVVNFGLTLIAILFAAAYLFTLYHFWNIWLVLAGAILMASRVPDLLWEIHSGRKVTTTDAPKSPLHLIATVSMWGTLLVIWYSLCVF